MSIRSSNQSSSCLASVAVHLTVIVTPFAAEDALIEVGLTVKQPLVPVSDNVNDRLPVRSVPFTVKVLVVVVPTGMLPKSNDVVLGVIAGTTLLPLTLTEPFTPSLLILILPV